MKRILTFLFVTLMSIGAWAQHWTGPSDSEYITSTPVYVQVKVDGKMYLGSSQNLEIAAFIGDECRGVGQMDATKGYFVVRVYGNDGSDGTTNDLGKSITFKAYCDGVEYQFTKTATFDGEQQYPPIDLNLDLVGGAKLPESKEYTSSSFPYAINLGSEAAVKYVDVEGNEVTTLKGESQVLTQFSFSWESLSSNIECTSSSLGTFNVLAVSNPTSLDKVYVELQNADGAKIGEHAICAITVTQEAIPVTAINAIFSSYSTDLVTITEQQVRDRMYVYFTPYNATNKEYELVPVDPAKKLFTTDVVPAAGTYQYYVQSVSNPEVKTIINITVYSVPTEIQIENDVVYVKSTNTLDQSHFGNSSVVAFTNQDAIYNVLRQKLGQITILPSTAYQQNVGITQPAGSTPAFQKVSTWYKTSPVGEYTYRIESTIDPNVYKDFKVSIFVPAQLYVTNYTVDLPVGSTYQELVDALGISVSDEATFPDWEIVAPAGQESPAALKKFNQAGEFHYTVQLVKDPFNESNKANITVNIYNPVTAVVVNEGVTMKNGKGYLEVEPGDNVKELLIANAHVVPADAANADLQANVNASLYEEGIEDKLLDWEGKATDAEGEYEFIVSAVNYPNATPASFIVKFAGNPHFVFTEGYYELSKYRDTEITLTCTREEYDPSKVNLITKMHYDNGNECAIVEKLDETGLRWKVRGLRNGSIQATVAYGDIVNNSEIIWKAWSTADWEANEAVNMNCLAEMKLVKGWDWIAPNAFNSDGIIPLSAINFNKSTGNSVVEMRSQTDLLYNDPSDGVFGTISQLSISDGMYKVKTESTSDVYDYVVLSDNYNSPYYAYESAVKKITRRGYNWIGTGLQYSHYFANIVDYLTPNYWDVSYNAQEGDRLIGKNGFAEFDGEEWLYNSDFVIEANKGYMYYTLSPQNTSIAFGDYPYEYVPDDEYELNGFPGAPIAEAKSAFARKTNVWNYDASQFADNMCIVAELDGMTGDESCTIGAFVDGECRGKGQFVKGNKMFINVAGKAGEKVTFKLYDEDTDFFYDVDNVLTYSAMAGSLSKPVVLSSGSHATGIKNVNSEASTDKMTHDISGRRVNTVGKHGVYIVNGKKILK